jgi:hypothetical protein
MMSVDRSSGRVLNSSRPTLPSEADAAVPTALSPRPVTVTSSVKPGAGADSDAGADADADADAG